MFLLLGYLKPGPISVLCNKLDVQEFELDPAMLIGVWAFQEVEPAGNGLFLGIPDS